MKTEELRSKTESNICPKRKEQMLFSFFKITSDMIMLSRAILLSSVIINIHIYLINCYNVVFQRFQLNRVAWLMNWVQSLYWVLLHDFFIQVLKLLWNQIVVFFILFLKNPLSTDSNVSLTDNNHFCLGEQSETQLNGSGVS